LEDAAGLRHDYPRRRTDGVSVLLGGAFGVLSGWSGVRRYAVRVGESQSSGAPVLAVSQSSAGERVVYGRHLR